LTRPEAQHIFRTRNSEGGSAQSPRHRQPNGKEIS
jgi:hypothetical protein